MLKISRSQLIFGLIIIVLAFGLTYGLVGMPAYPDAYYHYNVANRLAMGDGFVDDYLWIFIGAPDSLPAPSNLYWMPMTGILGSLGMSVFNAPDSYRAAQFFFALMTAGVGFITYRFAFLLGGRLRHAWIAGLLSVIGGFFAARWGTMDTFAPYAFIGALALLFMGLGMVAKQRNWLYWVLAGIFAGLGHLTRADGLLLILTAWSVLFFPFDFFKTKFINVFKQRLFWFGLVTLFYVLTMSPWFMRNLHEIGTILPVGGTQSIWFTEYNDLFNYPPDVSPDTLFADGLSVFGESRWVAFTNNLATFVAVEGLIVLTPLMLIGLWRRRDNLLLRGFWIFAVGIHLAMTFVFPFPGYRGGLFHAVAALIPFWMVLGILGLDDVVDWIAKRRRAWKPQTAKPIFSIMMLFIGIALTVTVALPASVGENQGLGRIYTGLQEQLPRSARIMINDPAQLYYFLGMGGVTIPNESVDIVPTIARQYDIDYLVLEFVTDDGFIGAAPINFQFDANNPPDFLEPIPFDNRKDVRLYAIIKD